MRTMFTAGEWNDDEDAAKVLQRDDGVLLLVLLCRCCFFVLLLVLFSLYFIVVGFMLTFFFNFHCVTPKLLLVHHLSYILPLLLLYFVFVKPSKHCCLNSS